jgi:hypothetical protein
MSSALVVVDRTDPEQAAWLEYVVGFLSDSHDITVCDSGQGTSTSRVDGDQAIAIVSPSSAEHLRLTHVADTVIVLDPEAGYCQRSIWQRVVSISTFDDYMRFGPLFARAEDESTDRSPAPVAYVLGSPVDERHDIGDITCEFRANPALEDGVLLELTELLTGRRQPVANRQQFFLYLESDAQILDVAPEIRAELSTAASAGDIRLTIVSSREPSTFRIAGFHHFSTIERDEFKAFAHAGGLGPEDVIIFNEPTELIADGLARSSAKKIFLDNLELLRMRDRHGLADYAELGTDAARFHIATLETAYDRLECARRSVGIIIPTYNRPIETLSRSVRSALGCARNHANVRVTVIDDGSEVSPESALRDIFGDQISVLSKHNEGLGLTRNYGVMRSETDYVFFLDDDDEVVSENLRYFVAHAELNESAMVVGKRVLCDLSGDFLADSLDYCFRGVSRGASHDQPAAFDDSMANNKLIRREALLEAGIFFRSGYYEDNDFAARCLNDLANVQLLNFPIHKWFQGENDSSITTTFSPEHMRDKIQSLTHAWRYLPNAARPRRIRFNAIVDLPPTLRQADSASADDARRVRRELDRYRALWPNYMDSSLKSLVAGALETGRGRRAPTATDAELSGDGRHFFFPRTHFQVLSTMALIHQRTLRGVIVLDSSIPAFDRGFRRRVKRSGYFESVRIISNQAVGRAMGAHLRLGSAGATVIYDVLFKEYSDSLPDIRRNDSAVIFHEGWPERYFIFRSFSKVIKAEDGYGSTQREFELAYADGVWGRNRERNGMWGMLNILVQESHGAWHSRPVTAQEILATEPPQAGIHKGGYETAVVSHFDVADSCSDQRFRTRFKSLYREGRPPGRNTSVVLTQPLFFDYCTVAEHLAVVAYLVSLATEATVVLKPHPMDPCDYGDRLRVLPSKNPSELLGFGRNLARESISFGSTGGLAVPISESSVSVLGPGSVSSDSVKAEIHRICYVEGWMESEQAREWLRLNEANIQVGGRLPTFGARESTTRVTAERLAASVRTAGTLAMSDRSKAAEAARRRLSEIRIKSLLGSRSK